MPARDNDRHRIALDGEWLLDELSEFSWNYTQVYAFLCEFELRPPASAHPSQEVLPFADYPWRGGYSTVNLFNKLVYGLSPTSRPRILAIRYSSPGFIDLALWAAGALAVRRAVKAVVDSIDAVEGLYDKIYKHLHERRLMKASAKRDELNLAKDELKVIREYCEEYGQITGTGNATAALLQRTKNPLAAIKILLSFHRRLRVLAASQKDKKAIL